MLVLSTGIGSGPTSAAGGLEVESNPVDGMPCLPVGDPGNACDPQIDGCYGSVANDYGIGQYEVTFERYAEFLNAVAASDSNGLYDVDNMYGIDRTGSPGSYAYQATDLQGPVAARFYDALRYANWMHNGEPVGAQDVTTTEDGAYTFTGPSAVGARNPGAVFALPTEDEWYKAAYYDPGTANYFLYPTGTDTTVTCAPPTPAANHANCDFQFGPTTVGSYPGSPSPSGTFDQGGNLWEWTESELGPERVIRGGSWINPPSSLSAPARFSIDPATPLAETNAVGFRVTCLPEPGTAASLLAGASALIGLGRGRRDVAFGYPSRTASPANTFFIRSTRAR